MDDGKDLLEARQQIEVCFNTKIDRDCENCLAHGDYGGPCCYGSKFEADDDAVDGCMECRHYYECGEECGHEFDEEDVRLGPKGDPIRPLGPPIRTTVWDRLRENRTRTEVARPSRFTAQPRPTYRTVESTPQRTRSLVPSTDEHKHILMDNRIPVGEVDANETAAKRFAKDSTWGGFEGFFRAAYDFFRTHRWG